jgi:ribosome-associated protein
MAGERASDDLPIGQGASIPARELRWRFSRSGGPGGQNVNTTDSRVELSVDLARSEALPPVLKARALERLRGRLVGGVLQITASEHRSQWRNRLAAQRRLEAVLRQALRPPPPPRRPTRPSRAAVERRLAAKQRRAALKGSRRRQRLPED